MSITEARLKKENIVQVYSGIAPIYDLWGRLTETKARRRALDLARVRNGEAILEVALGTGLTFRELLEANSNGVNFGIDITPAMLEKARLNLAKSGLTNYELSLGDAYNLDFPDGRFDLVMNNYMFDLLPEKDFLPVLGQFKRVLKPAGRIVLVNMTQGEHLYQRFYEAIYHLKPALMGGCRGVLLSRALETAGFKNISRETVSQFGFPSEILTATN